MEGKLNRLLLTAALLLITARIAFSANRCPDCGSTAVPYPLSTSPTCGEQAYKISCNAGSLVFPTLNNTYPITSINPSSQRLVIQPANLLPNTCIASDLPFQGVQLNSSLPFNVSSSNTILYLNCTETLLSSPLNCSSASLCHSYINSTNSASPCGENSPICCTLRAVGSSISYSIRVRDSGCRAYTSFVNLNPDLPVSRWPQPGMEIQWISPAEPVCGSQADCDRNSTCGPDPTLTGISRCFCNNSLSWDPVQGICINKLICQSQRGCGGADRTALIAGLTAGLGGALAVTIVALLVYKRHRRIIEAQDRLTSEREAILNANNGGRQAKVFTGKEIKKATNNFAQDRILGAGGYGEVYKGTLNDGTVVAVKSAKLGNAKGTDQVLNEVRVLCQVNHRSLVRLLGCCVELQQPILVYEYIENGNLFEHLHTFSSRQTSDIQSKNQLFQTNQSGDLLRKTSNLTWKTRLQIALDTAEGLSYLHFSANPAIYHRDVKSNNILIDKKMNAKVADFGLSRLAHTDMSHISTCAQGTLGYLDPEYYRNYQLTDKSDVYSFGVVLLELLTSQKAIDFGRDADDVNLAVYVQRMAEEERLMEVVDLDLREKASPMEVDTMKALGFLALSCLEEKRQNRPSMKEVAEEIEYIMSIVVGSGGSSKKVERGTR